MLRTRAVCRERARPNVVQVAGRIGIISQGQPFGRPDSVIYLEERHQNRRVGGGAA